MIWEEVDKFLKAKLPVITDQRLLRRLNKFLLLRDLKIKFSEVSLQLT